MRPIYWTKETEGVDKEKISEMQKKVIEYLSEYLKWFKPKIREGAEYSYTKTSIMGPVGKLLSAVSSGKIENPDALVGYIVNIHNATAENPISKQANEHLENGVNALLELRKIAPKRMWMKILREVDYAVYKNKLEYIFGGGRNE
ncbi:hypothetical protein DRN72_03970 [Methanosarcinales archaeon]|nr:MAG: hypothetical protein DRN72_03970 [Methanosarcinales archaeon]